MAVFGEGYRVFVESLLHNEYGYCDERAYRKLVSRLVEKIVKNRRLITAYELKIKPESEILLLAYGSLARSVKEYVLDCWGKGDYRFGFLRPISLWPSFLHDIRHLLQKIKEVIVFEMNMGQYYLEVDRALKDKKVHFIPWLHTDIPLPEEIGDLTTSILRR